MISLLTIFHARFITKRFRFGIIRVNELEGNCKSQISAIMFIVTIATIASNRVLTAECHIADWTCSFSILFVQILKGRISIRFIAYYTDIIYNLKLNDRLCKKID